MFTSTYGVRSFGAAGCFVGEGGAATTAFWGTGSLVGFGGVVAGAGLVAFCAGLACGLVPVWPFEEGEGLSLVQHPPILLDIYKRGCCRGSVKTQPFSEKKDVGGGLGIGGRDLEKRGIFFGNNLIGLDHPVFRFIKSYLGTKKKDRVFFVFLWENAPDFLPRGEARPIRS